MEKICSTIRKLSVLVWVVPALVGTAHGQTLLYSEGFETDGEGSRYTSNTYTDCTNSDFFIRTNTNPVTPPSCGALFSTVLTNVQGSFFWASEDIRSSTPTPGARPPGDITTQSFNIASHGSLTVSLYVACSANSGTRWESADSINIQTSINGGPFRTFGRFMGKGTPVVGANLGIDGNLNGAYDAGVDPATNVDVANFTQYTFNISGTGSNMRVRLDFDQMGGTEELAIDLIEVRGVLIVPVKWASFSGHQVNEAVELNWATTEEVGVREFQVERFSLAHGYQPIGAVKANGEAGSYRFIDRHPLTGANLYRIRQVDEDNAFSFSEIVEVSFTPRFSVVLYPNPMREGSRLVMAGEPATGTLLVLDPAGRVISSREFTDATELEIQRAGLPAGVYFARLDLKDGSAFTQKFIVQD
jgi:hypothetical protein